MYIRLYIYDQKIILLTRTLKSRLIKICAKSTFYLIRRDAKQGRRNSDAVDYGLLWTPVAHPRSILFRINFEYLSETFKSVRDFSSETFYDFDDFYPKKSVK